MNKYSLTGSFDEKNTFVYARRQYDIGVRVKKWFEIDGYDGYKRPLRIKKRNRDVRQLLVHHAGQDRLNPGVMYHVLWDIRKLSVHFAYDEPFGVPTIYQFVDADWVCLHAGKMNSTSVGIEICHYPSAWQKPDYYNQARNDKNGNVPHEIVEQPVFSVKRKIFKMTDATIDAVARLYAGCWVALKHDKHLTGVVPWTFKEPPKFPKNREGEIPWDTIFRPREHYGLIAHRHCSKRKWDPAGMDFYEFEERVEKYWNIFNSNFQL
jgi:hypothetical protein